LANDGKSKTMAMAKAVNIFMPTASPMAYHHYGLIFGNLGDVLG
jgi:hypothetical protein